MGFSFLEFAPSKICSNMCLSSGGQQTACASRTREDRHSLNEDTCIQLGIFFVTYSPVMISFHVCILCDKNINLLLKDEIHYKEQVRYS